MTFSEHDLEMQKKDKEIKHLDEAFNGMLNAIREKDALLGNQSKEIERLKADRDKALSSLMNKSEEIAELKRKHEDEMADYDNNMLRKFDIGAAQSTDLYTWIRCRLNENIRLKSEMTKQHDAAWELLNAKSEEVRKLKSENEKYVKEIARLWHMERKSKSEKADLTQIVNGEHQIIEEISEISNDRADRIEQLESEKAELAVALVNKAKECEGFREVEEILKREIKVYQGSRAELKEAISGLPINEDVLDTEDDVVSRKKVLELLKGGKNG